MSESGQNTTNEKELSLGLLKQRRVLVLISIILAFFIFGFVTIENIELFNGIKIHIEELSIKIILLVLILYFWLRYWQYSKVGEHRAGLEKRKEDDITKARQEFFRKMACNNIKECFDAKKRFDVEGCLITEIEDMPSAWLSFPKRQNIEIYQYKIQDKISSSGNPLNLNPSEIEKIEQNGWKRIDPNNKKAKIIFYKTFSYSWLKLKCTLFWAKVKFYFTSTYFTDYLLPHYLAVAALLSLFLPFYYLSNYWLICLTLFLIVAVVKECFWIKAYKQSEKHQTN